MSEPQAERVTVYVTRWCAYCRMATGLLRAAGVDFEEIDLTHDHERRRWLALEVGRRTVPQIFLGNRVIGGFRELVQFERDGGLEQSKTLGRLEGGG